MLDISFTKATLDHEDTIFGWLEEPHMKEFWDNSQEHKDDILSFMKGREGPSSYEGIFVYWVGFFKTVPFCFALTSPIHSTEELPALWKAHLSRTGNTYSLDFGIGTKEFLGKGLAASTLEAFCAFFYQEVDPLADTFFIDPDENNPRAKHVYEKAGFKEVGNFKPSKGFFEGHTTFLMVKCL